MYMIHTMLNFKNGFVTKASLIPMVFSLFYAWILWFIYMGFCMAIYA